MRPNNSHGLQDWLRTKYARASAPDERARQVRAENARRQEMAMRMCPKASRTG